MMKQYRGAEYISAAALLRYQFCSYRVSSQSFTMDFKCFSVIFVVLLINNFAPGDAKATLDLVGLADKTWDTAGHILGVGSHSRSHGTTESTRREPSRDYSYPAANRNYEGSHRRNYGASDSARRERPRDYGYPPAIPNYESGYGRNYGGTDSARREGAGDYSYPAPI